MAKSLVVNTRKKVESNRIITRLGGNFGRCRTGLACSGYGEQKSNPSIDEVSKVEGGSKSTPEGRRGFALVPAPHHKSSPMISAQERTRSDVKGQENPGQASGDRLHAKRSDSKHPGSCKLTQGRAGGSDRQKTASQPEEPVMKTRVRLPKRSTEAKNLDDDDD